MSSQEPIYATESDEGPRAGILDRLTLANGPRREIGPEFKERKFENVAWGILELPPDIGKFEIGVVCVLEEKS